MRVINGDFLSGELNVQTLANTNLHGTFIDVNFSLLPFDDDTRFTGMFVDCTFNQAQWKHIRRFATGEFENCPIVKLVDSIS
jgi:hypothetical protein